MTPLFIKTQISFLFENKNSLPKPGILQVHIFKYTYKNKSIYSKFTSFIIENIIEVYKELNFLEPQPQ